MAFQIKDFASITASMINHARRSTTKITDYLPGSVARTVMEAPAVEIEELYHQMFLGLREAIPVATFRSFGFDRLQPAYARGYVSVSAESALDEALEIPAGTIFTTTDEREYLSSEDVTWASGETSARIPVIASEVGGDYNVAEGGISDSPAFSSGFSISNSAIESGRDRETDGQRETRFAEYVAALSRGTNDACLYAVKKAMIEDGNGRREYVTRAGLHETPGFVRLYVYSSAGAPSEALLNQGQRIIDGYRDENTGEIVTGYRAGGVRMDVLAMSERQIDYSASIEMQSGRQFTQEVQQRLDDAFATQLAAAQPSTTLYVGAIRTALLNVPGVFRVTPSVNENIVCGANEVLVPGALTLTEV